VTAKQLGADGVVLGLLSEDGHVDTAQTRRLMELARPLKVTFHRAFDMSRHLNQSLKDLIELGVDRTSGEEQTAELGQAKIAELNRAESDSCSK
jgi:copper homeostasis protein